MILIIISFQGIKIIRFLSDFAEVEISDIQMHTQIYVKADDFYHRHIFIKRYIQDRWLSTDEIQEKNPKKNPDLNKNSNPHFWNSGGV